MKLLKLLSIVLGLSTLGLIGTEANAQSRNEHRIGLGFGVLSDPVPSFFSYHLKFNATHWLQFTGSFGNISASGASVDPTTGAVIQAGGSVKTFGASAKAFLIPKWSLSPFVSAGYSYSMINGSFSLSGETIGSNKESLNTIVAGAGLDHQAFIGFNIGAGVNYVIAPTEISDALSIIPNFYIGWFF